MSEEVLGGLVQRGVLLKEQGRYPDAERCFREAIGLNPEFSELYFHLAFCLYAQDNHKAALVVVEKAIQTDPSDGDNFALKAFILCSLRRKDEAVKMAEEAVGLNPFSSYAVVARTFVLLQLEKWSEAETWARRALELDPDNVTASNFLAQALRLQNKMQENAEQIAYSLAKAPDNDDTHAAAGWSALQRGERLTAETHFLEALRLDPNNPLARQGLLESYKARSPLYRVYLSYCFWMQRLNEKARWAVILGLLVFMKVASTILVGPWAVLYLPLAIVYLVFCLWVHVAGGVGNLILLTDRLARHALNPLEKWEGILVGGGVMLGLPFMAVSLIIDNAVLMTLSMVLVGVSFPLAYTLTNESRIGQLLFGAIALLVLTAGAANILLQLDPERISGSLAKGLGTAAFISVIGTTWLANVPYLRRAP